MKNLNKLISPILIIALLSLALLSSCSLWGGSQGNQQKMSFAETVFEVTLSQPLSQGEILLLEVLDEITGITLNPTRYEMKLKDEYSYFIRVPLGVGSAIKYRYVRQSLADSSIERDTSGKTVAYRLTVVRKAAVVRDYVTGWDSSTFTGPIGEISGFIYDKKTEAPLAEIMVSINGLQTFTSSDGFYEIKNIPVGEYNLVAYHPAGRMQAFQQRAIIAANCVTPASFGMHSAKLVSITFRMTPPEQEKTEGVVRLIGNLYSLGNSLREQRGGVSVLASQAPVMQRQENGEFALTLDLPEGFDLRYKYSLGDGFINAERKENGGFNSRQVIIPNKSITLHDAVSTWSSSGSTPVVFSLTVPKYTPANDEIAIQFNPFVWMEPMPMQRESNGKWHFTLYSPLEYLNGAQFRFCRNAQCGLADDALTSGENAIGYQLDLAAGSKINYQLESWAGLAQVDFVFQPVSIPASHNIFIKGIELDPAFEKKDLPGSSWGIIDAAVTGANLFILSPTWSFSQNNSESKLNFGRDLLAFDLESLLATTQEAGLSSALYPQPRFSMKAGEYWTSSQLTYNWWHEWYKTYERFILHYADFAEAKGIQTLIIGGHEVAPAFPNGSLENGSPSNVPYDSAEIWSALIDKTRTRFSGQIYFALPYRSDMSNTPEFISKADAIYVEFSSAMSDSNSPSLEDLKTRVSQALDNTVYKLYATYQKPIILGMQYTALDGSASDCINAGGSCGEVIATMDDPFTNVDAAEQALIYQAIIEETIQRNWIFGLIAKGYRPSVNVLDNSASIYGKPAASVLAHYFNSLKR